MNSDTIINTISGILLIIGLIGTIAPILPGSIAALIGLIIFKFSVNCTFGWSTIVIAGAFVLLGYLIDYFLPNYLTKRLNGSEYGVTGSTIGLTIGLFFPPVGVILGPIIGIFLAELFFSKKNARQALKLALSSFASFILTKGYNIILVIIFIIVYIRQLFF